MDWGNAIFSQAINCLPISILPHPYSAELRMAKRGVKIFYIIHSSSTVASGEGGYYSIIFPTCLSLFDIGYSLFVILPFLIYVTYTLTFPRYNTGGPVLPRRIPGCLGKNNYEYCILLLRALIIFSRGMLSLWAGSPGLLR